jgi:AraC family transcriptional activator of pobA
MTPHLKVHSLEWFRSQPSRINNPGFYEIIWIKTGTGILTVDLDDYLLSTDTIYCLAPGRLSHLQSEDHTLQGYYISLSAEFVYIAEVETNTIFSSSFIQPLIIQMEEEKEYAEQVLQRIQKELSNDSSGQKELLKGLLRIFLLYIARNITAIEVSGKEADLFRQFMLLLRNNIVTLKMVADYAGVLCITPQYLNRLVKRVTGLTASQYIQQTIILEAKRRAVNSNSSMKEIAYNLGFTDTTHFSKFFKNCTGVSFSTFKQEAVS